MSIREIFTNLKEKNNLSKAEVTTQIKSWTNVWQKTRTTGILENKSGMLKRLVSWTTKYTLIMKISNLRALITTTLM